MSAGELIAIEELEKKYFELFFKILNKKKHIMFLKDQLHKINNRLAWVKNYKPDNTIEKPMQEAVRMIFLEEAIKLGWKPSTLPASSDTFFEIPKECFINFDIKTVKMIDGDVDAIIKHVTGRSFHFKRDSVAKMYYKKKANELDLDEQKIVDRRIQNEIAECRKLMLEKLKPLRKKPPKIQDELAYKVILQVEPNQSNYPNKTPYGRSSKQWEGPNLRPVYDDIPVFCFFIQFIWYYERGSKGKNKIIVSTLNSVPNGKLYKIYKQIIRGYKTLSVDGEDGKCVRIPMEKLRPKKDRGWNRAKLLPDYN